MTDMPRPRPKHLHRETTRHGEVVWYFRRGSGPRTRLRAAYGTKEFAAEYDAALRGQPLADAPKTGTAGTLDWLVSRYMTSAHWTEALSVATRGQRAGVLKETVRIAGTAPIETITARAIREGMDRRASRPHGANNWLKTMRGLFAFAVEREYLPADPTRGVKLLGGPNDRNGFHTWTEEEVARFEIRWPLGTRERLALDLLLYTGLRRGDAARVGRPHVRDGRIRIETEKTSQEVTIRILPPLAASIAASPVGEMTFIAGERGRPMTKESFGNWFRDACAAAGVPGRAHGLRKAGARRAAENGATEAELNAWFGWAEGSRESATYVRGANRKKLAERIADRWNDEAPPTRSRIG